MNLMAGDVFHRGEDTSSSVMGQKDPLNLYGVVLISMLNLLLGIELLSATFSLGFFYEQEPRATVLVFHLIGAIALCATSTGDLKSVSLT